MAASAMMGSHAPAQSYTNPVVGPTAADPSVARGPDGTFWLVATQDAWEGREHYLPLFSSTNLIDWTYVGDVFAFPPSWKEDRGFLWAPDLGYRDGRWEIYYAYSQWGDPNPCIGLATASDPAGSWEDLGRPVFCSADIGVGNSIDPFLWVEDGVRTMVWGSFHGIHAAQLDAAGTTPVGGATRIADDRFEAPYVIRRDGWYYLFLSSGSCCEGAASTYITWVGRSEDLRGPYRDARGSDLLYGGGELVLFQNDAWVGPGHNAVVADDTGADWIVYHAISPERPFLENGATRRPVLLDRIDWVDGWPVVNGGDGPSSELRTAPEIR